MGVSGEARPEPFPWLTRGRMFWIGWGFGWASAEFAYGLGWFA